MVTTLHIYKRWDAGVRIAESIRVLITAIWTAAATHNSGEIVSSWDFN